MAESEEAKALRRRQRAGERAHDRGIRNQSAKELIGSWHKVCKDRGLGSSTAGLNNDIWTRVLRALCEDSEEGDDQGITSAARDICRLGAVCKELWTSTQYGLEHLSTLCPAIEGPQELWQQFLFDPCSLKLPQLRQLARVTPEVLVSDPKPLLIVNLLRRLGLEHPNPGPANLFVVTGRQMRHMEPLLKAAELAERVADWVDAAGVSSFISLLNRELAAEEGIQSDEVVEEGSQSDE